MIRASLLAMLCVLVPGFSARADAGIAAVLAGSDARVSTGNVNLETVADTGPDGDRDVAPFLYVAGGDPEKDALPVKSVSVNVDVAGVIARVRVNQVFENTGKKAIEAVYVFPASTRAAVHGMRMKVGGRTLEAKIEGREMAREHYETAKGEGRRASLLEQQRANVFSMNVANLMPGDRVDVELDYSELLVPTEGVYEFVFPTVVGPRYAGGADPVKDKWIANPTVAAFRAEPIAFDLSAHLSSAIPIKDVSSPSHQVAVCMSGESNADVKLIHSANTANTATDGNKDFILRYRLAGARIESGLMLYPGQSANEDNYFLLMMEPPQRPSAADVVPREYIFVLDVSGSMYGFPLDTAKTLIKKLIAELRPTDHFNLVLFAGASATMSAQESMPATPEYVQAAMMLIDAQQGGGGTELMGGLSAAYGIPRLPQAPGTSRNVVLITDGYVGVEAQSYKFVRAHLNDGNLFAFGIGTSVNRALIEGLARAGQGVSFVVHDQNQAAAEADRFRTYVDRPVLTNIALRFDGFGAYDVAPANIPDVMAERPVVVIGKYRGAPSGKINLTGYAGAGIYHDTIDVGPQLASARNAPLGVLWARKWVEMLDDAHHMDSTNQEIEKIITTLGLAHHLLTSFTSFVAVDSEVVNKGGKSEQVRQPLAMPEGVSELAVGGGLADAMAGLPEELSPPSSPAPAPVKMKSASGHASGQLMRHIAPVSKTLSESTPSRNRAHHSSLGSMSSSPMASYGSAAMVREVSSVPTIRLSTQVVRAEQLSSTGPLITTLEAALKNGLGDTMGAQVLRLRIGVDGSGRLVKLEWLGAANAALESRVRAAISLMRTATIAVGAATGTIEVFIFVSP